MWELSAVVCRMLCNLSKFSVLMIALDTCTGAEAAVLPHSHGSHEAAPVSSIGFKEVLIWSFSSTRSPRCPATAQTHKEEGQGGALFQTSTVTLLTFR